MAAAAAAPRSTALKLDWSHITSSLSLRGSTASALTAFKKRNDDARRRVNALSAQSRSVDFAHYRSVLANSAVVDEIEAQFKKYEVKRVDLGRQLKAIEAFETQAVKQAEETKALVDREVEGLARTLRDIEGARGFDELTVDEVVAAKPELDERVERLVKNHKWMPPGYQEKFGDLSLL